MKPGPTSACRELPRVLDLASPPRPATEWLAAICLECDWCSSSAEATEMAERWTEAFLRHLRSELNAMEERGRISFYSFNSSSEYMIQGSCFVEPRDPASTVLLKTRRLGQRQYSEAFDAMTPRQFEALCRGILALLGSEAPRLTPHSRDEGIDFYGRLPLRDLISPAGMLPGFHQNVKVWLVGQAKHHPSGQAATSDIRELVGAVTLARAGAYSTVGAKYQDLRVRVCDPVCFLFFTTGMISPDGWRLLDSSGVLAMDGAMLAAYLADKSVGFAGDRFDATAFSGWLKEQEDD